ncbi:MAG: hypothetical protein UDG85_02455 [Anaerostipes hadrus]|nr:hypothetical protein [Anaerostipes hadrus]
MKSNINKLIMIEVIAGILFAFIASKILHMTEALQIMYLPFELIGKGLRVLSLSSAIGNVIAIIIYAAISMIPAIYVIYQRKRGRTHKEDILLVVFTGLLFYSLYMFINPGLMYQKMPDIFSMDQSSLIVMKIIYAFIIYSVPIMKAIRFLGDDSQKNWKSRLYFGMKGLIAALVSYYTLLITYAKTFELLHKSENKLQNVSSIEWFKSVLQLLPIIMTILLFINIIHVVKAIEDHKEEQQMTTVARLAGVAKVTAAVTVISDFILNFYQFLLGATLQNVNVTFAPDVSMEPLIIAFGALIFHEYFKRTKQLKEENDQFI